MDHSALSYIRRQSTQALEAFLVQYAVSGQEQADATLIQQIKQELSQRQISETP